MQSDFRENLKLALDTVRAHKLRSFLAILGVMIGVALIILVVGLVQGFRADDSGRTHLGRDRHRLRFALRAGPRRTAVIPKMKSCASSSRWKTPWPSRNSARR